MLCKIKMQYVYRSSSEGQPGEFAMTFLSESLHWFLVVTIFFLSAYKLSVAKGSSTKGDDNVADQWWHDSIAAEDPGSLMVDTEESSNCVKKVELRQGRYARNKATRGFPREDNLKNWIPKR